MKRVMIASIIILSLLFLVACGTSEENTEQEPPLNTEETQDEIPEEDPPNESEDSIEDTRSDEAIEFTYNPEEVEELDLDIKLLSGEEWEYDFDRDDQEGKIEYENGSDEEREGPEVFQEIEDILSAINIDLDRPISEMIDEVLNRLGVDRNELKEIGLKIDMYSGEKIGFKYHLATSGESNTIDEFDMDIEFITGQEWEYEYKLNDGDYEIEYSDGSNLDGQEAKDEMDRILSEVTIGLDRTIEEMKAEFLAAIDVTEDEIEEWDIEVEYESQEKIQAKYDRS